MMDCKTQKELRETYNPDGSLLRKHQLKMLEMLKYIDQVCRKHAIDYWLCSGTLLGAVRHGGFIPWDDDVDIEMRKEDYQRLIEILKRDIKAGYALQIHETDENHFCSASGPDHDGFPGRLRRQRFRRGGACGRRHRRRTRC